MPPIAFSFGSFGDIVALIQLASSIQQLFADSDIPDECQNLVEYLTVFNHTLAAVQERLRTSSLAIATDNAIRHSIAICRQLIQDFEDETRLWQRSRRLTRSAGWFALDSFCQRLSWITRIRPEAEKLRERLQSQAQIINLLLALSTYVIRTCQTSHFCWTLTVRCLAQIADGHPTLQNRSITTLRCDEDLCTPRAIHIRQLFE